MDYAALNTRARNLIQDYGTALTLQRASFTTFSPTLGRYTSNATTSYTVYGVIRAPNRMWMGDTYRFGDITIESSDREVVLATNDSVVPDVGDHLIIAGIAYRVLACNTVQPGGTDLLYKVLCRK